MFLPFLFGLHAMDELLDLLWSKIVIGVGHIVDLMNLVLAPLEVLGPAPVILILVLVTVCGTKLFSGVYTTKRYESLKKEFSHWFNLRQEALAVEDREKGKLLAKNIDQGKLNKVYYDYFFEGLLKNLLTIYLPVLIVAAYVNEAYQPNHLMEKFGRNYVFKISSSDGDPIIVGALFCYVIMLLTTYLCWYLVGRATGCKKRKRSEKKVGADPIDPD